MKAIIPKLTYTILFLFVCSSADIISESYALEKVYTISQWKILDIEFECSQLPEAPFELIFGAILDGPEDKQMNVPGFYAGGKRYILRVCPPEKGEWHFRIYSDLKELSGQQGIIRVSKNNDKDVHGPVMIQKMNSKHFSYTDGTPYFLLAYELDWLFAMDLETTPELPKTNQLIDTLAEYGFNQVIMNVYAHDVDWNKDPQLKKKHDYGSPSIWPFGGSNNNPDFSILNTRFFDHLDLVIDKLGRKEIIAHLMIYVWNKEVNWPDMHTKADNRYFDYVVKRYQAFPNLIWDISKEALSYGRCDMDYVTDRIMRLRRLDGHGRLLTVHDYSYCKMYPQLVDFISVQNWRTDLQNEMLRIYEEHVTQPVFNIEHGGYERGKYDVFMGNYTDPVTCLERSYLCLFAGVYSTYYWQNTSWNVIIHNPMDLPPNERPGFELYKYLTAFFKRYPFASFKPQKYVSSSGYCLSDLENRHLFLVPPDHVAINVYTKKIAGKEMDVIWFDPLTGEYSDRKRRTMTGWNHFDSPDTSQMHILILE